LIGVGAFAVFALGLRHGADPDHLAAIDNLTRSALARRPALSRFVGSLFAVGHSVMVLALAALVGILGQRFAVHGALVERIGTWVSVLMLTLIGLMNIQQLRQVDRTHVRGMKARLIPPALLNATHPFIAVFVGFLFGFGFETSSQIVTYAIAFGSGGLAGALFIGALFCFGMIITDTLDSLLVHRLVRTASETLSRAVVVWTWSVAAMALAVAAYELAQLLGWHSPIPDIGLSGILIGALLCVFTYVFLSTRTPRGSLSAVGGIISRAEELS
jgi:nickel/cobalt transporter (NiCoT) family protein